MPIGLRGGGGLLARVEKEYKLVDKELNWQGLYAN